jgi:hypothetical protein
MIRARLRRFLADEDGAVTADWVALTASVVLVGALAVHIVGQSMVDVSVEIAAALENARLANITVVKTSSGSSSDGSGASSDASAF